MSRAPSGSLSFPLNKKVTIILDNGAYWMDNTSAYRWAIGILISIVLVLSGLFMGQRLVAADLGEHTSLEGHPVLVERVERQYNELQRQMATMQKTLDDILKEVRGN